MIKQISHLLKLALPLLLVSQTAFGQSASDVYSKVKRSVGIVLVSTFEGQLVGSGSAVTVASQTMVTNRHVLIPGHRYQVMTSYGTFEAYMTSCDSTQDLCLLEVRNLDANPVEFGDANRLNVGDTVYAIGAPNEIGNILGVSSATKQKSHGPAQLTLSNGLITALRPVEDGKIIQTNAAVSPGSSGGGLFDEKGRLIGITTFAMRSGQGLNMALPVNWVERLGVSGAPRTAIDASAPNTQPFATVQQPRPATPVTVMEHEVAEQPSAAAPTSVDTSQSAQGLTQYWWVAIPVVLLLIFIMRRRNSEAEEIEYAPPQPTANPLLERFLAEARQELDQNRPDAALWSMVLADNKGNVDAAQQSYIERRAARLLSAEKDKQWAAAARQSQTT